MIPLFRLRNALTEAFLGSGINVTMDTGGNVFFKK